MPTRTSADRYREWMRPPAKPVPYPLRHRLADRVNGRRDGRRGIPRLSDTSRVETAWTRVLCNLTEERISAELLAYRSARAALVDLGKALAAVAAVLHQVSIRTEADLAEADKGPDYSVRRLADARHPEHIAENRRRAENVAQRRKAERRQEEVVGQLTQAVQAVAAFDHALRQEGEVVKVRVGRLRAHGARRVAHYWQQVVRKHPKGAELNERCAPQEPELRDWWFGADERWEW